MQKKEDNPNSTWGQYSKVRHQTVGSTIIVVVHYNPPLAGELCIRPCT